MRAVFDSWTNERAVQYRRLNRIPDEWGTAVNVQQMVFGNKGDDSGSGVAFSRDEVTGEPEPSGDFLQNAQGEDVVSGVRNTRELRELADLMPDAHAELMDILRTLERHYKDMQDTEFTIEEGRLYLLQTRAAKRPAQAAVRFAVDAVEEDLLSREEALLTVDPDSLDALLHPTFDPGEDYEVLARGVAASPGAAKGEVVFSAAAAVAARGEGRDVILVRPFTEADDVAGFDAARGILTSEGGKASHAALVARGMGRPCVCGASDLEIDVSAGTVSVNGTTLQEGDLIAINGTTGDITVDDVPLVEPEITEQFRTVLAWADDLRQLGVRANADAPADARRARSFGAEGIGLCRTEHMFMAPDRQPKMRAMIMAGSEEDRRAALEELRPLQQEDFEGLLEAMEGLPVTIRLLDPPLHEFLPSVSEVEQDVERARIEQSDDLEEGMREGEDYTVGTMIELPRACFVADRIARQADFFSFGTNDLTQTALGFSRDDIEGKILSKYLDRRIVDRSPFETIDEPGVGWLVRLAAWVGREEKPDLKLGICGEHGGDPDSIDFFARAGLDYVSCSAYRVPVARVAAAQAAIRRR